MEAGPHLLVFGRDTPPAEQSLLHRQFAPDGSSGGLFESLSNKQARTALGRFGLALRLLADAAPATSAEMGAVISEIILVRSIGNSGHPPFRAASSLQYWGAIVIDGLEQRTTLGICEALAHEAAHNSLFGFSPHNFFVWNSNDELYASPLRIDPRPLDGIFHAVFVLARMHFAVSELIRSGRLTAGQLGEARDMLARDITAFNEGREVLEAHARFTDEGRAILSAAGDYMANA